MASAAQAMRDILVEQARPKSAAKRGGDHARVDFEMAQRAADATHGPDLTKLVGNPIESSWVAWDTEEDAWFADEAVVLRIGRRQLEIVLV